MQFRVIFCVSARVRCLVRTVRAHMNSFIRAVIRSQSRTARVAGVLCVVCVEKSVEQNEPNTAYNRRAQRTQREAQQTQCTNPKRNGNDHQSFVLCVCVRVCGAGPRPGPGSTVVQPF